MMRSLYAGVSGIRNYQTWLDVIGNNIANVNTIGFKSSRATFAEMLTQTLRSATSPNDGFGGVNPIQVGLGVKLASVDTQFQQGALESTGNYTDLAIQGDGFFVLTDGTQKYFTRSGAFSVDADGYMTAQGGSMRLQGYMADQLGMIATNLAPGDIQIPFGMKAPASATTKIGLYCNLDAEGTDSTATLTDADSTGVTMVSGMAQNGAGGTHNIEVTGLNATQGSGMGANVSLAPLTLGTSLGDASLGITDFDNFTVTVDGGDAVPITGLDNTKTVQDLINAIDDQVTGVDASLDASGEIKLTRKQYGTGTSVTLAGDIANQVFGGTAFVYADGVASSLEAKDVFTPSQGGSTITTYLTLEANADGLITSITDLGGGGVTIFAAPDQSLASGGGLAAGDLVIETADTEHTTSIVTYDSLGGEHVMNMTFTKTAVPNIWTWEANVESPAQIVSGGTGTVTFNQDGSLQAFNYDGGVSGFTFNPNNGAAPTVTIDIQSGSIGGVDGITQFSSPSTTMVQSQDGYGMGNLINVSIDANGTILGSFSNDQTLTLGQIVLADFHNSQGLMIEGGNLYKMSANSGEPIYGLAQSNMGSSIYSGYVEMSNVDLSKQFADMIIAQRGFQASARVVTTADTVLDEIIRLKR